MIICFAGTPGSGKTYEAVKKILDNLCMGRVVYTNIDGMDDPQCQEMIKCVCGLSDFGLSRHLKFLEHDQLEDFWNHIEPGCLVVLDEIQKVFSSREWQTEKNKLFGSWASTHRHHGFDVVLITQHIERIDSAVRALVEWTYVFRKVNFFGGAVQKKYICYSYAGDETRTAPLSKNVRTYNQVVFLCYKSYTGKDVKELGIMKHVNVLKHPVFFAIPLVLAFTIYMVFFKSSLGTGDLFGSGKALSNLDKAKKQVVGQKLFDMSPGADQAVAEHSPSILRQTTSAGRILFTNRLSLQNRQNVQ
ncbi:zonular occludens toxin domain-containing protein [Desulfolithobacter sp.]